ncbi:MAG: MBL fold metallo-hydrolase [Candidatus Sericytochromatia bacterium]|nr:MBL fold metallo-hydrolase [Candidatus Tanganyikabacteria bacterium]
MRVPHRLARAHVLAGIACGLAGLAPLLGGAAAPRAFEPGRVHHLNGATLHPIGKWAVEGAGSLFDQGTLTSHMLLVEASASLILVEAALGLRDVAEPETRLPGFWRWLTRPVLDPGETALAQVERLGFRGSDVEDIVLTHLDLDHTGGLADFPAARVHVAARELTVATHSQAGRYRKVHWSHGPRWEPHEFGDAWFGFPSAVVSIDPEIRLVALPGHSDGHAGVALKEGARWLLHAGDAYFHRSELRCEPQRECPVGLEAFQTVAQSDGKVRLGTQERLRKLHRSGMGVRILSAHDPVELQEHL